MLKVLVDREDVLALAASDDPSLRWHSIVTNKS